MDRRLVTIKGRSEELGRPILYATSKQFLDHFGLASIADLPTLTELKPV
jgi:segregation and condensation protein B